MVFDSAATEGQEMNAIKIPRFIYGQLTLADALKFDFRGWHASQKMDGVWQQREFSNSILLGEKMRGGSFYVFDVPIAFGADVRQRAWIERREALREIARSFPAGMNIAPEGHGAEFLEAVLRGEGEGIVAKPFSSAFGVNWFKVKRRETFDVTVTAKLRGAIAISYEGQDAGKCALAGLNFDLVNVGDTVEIVAYCRNASGKFRDARFVRPRPDKSSIQPKVKI
jgi:hypothetical protein